MYQNIKIGANTTQNKQCFKSNKKFVRPQAELKQSKDQLDKFHGYIDAVNKFAHHYLYCRQSGQMLTVSESKILANERQKYLSFVKKNYKYKIPQQFLDKKLMRQRKDALLKKIKQQKSKKQQDQVIKSTKRPRSNKQKQQQKPARKRQKANNQPNADNQQQLAGKKKQDKSSKAKKQNKKAVQKQQNKEQQQGEQNNQMQQVIDDNFESQQDLQNDELDAFQDEDEN